MDSLLQSCSTPDQKVRRREQICEANFCRCRMICKTNSKCLAQRGRRKGLTSDMLLLRNNMKLGRSGLDDGHIKLLHTEVSTLINCTKAKKAFQPVRVNIMASRWLLLIGFHIFNH
jgi:hypothetical protein